MNSLKHAVITALGAVSLASAQTPARPTVTTVAATPTVTVMAWETLDRGFQDSDPEHRRTAVAAAGTIGPVPEAVRRVERALQDKATVVRQAAASTLGEMGARDAIPQLVTALDDNPEVSFTAAKALWDLGDPNGRWIFQQVLEGERKDTPGLVHGAVRDAKRKLHNPSQLALMGAKEAAGAFLGPASVGINVAEEAAKDAGAPGRTTAAAILGKDPDPYALTLLEWALADRSWVVRAAVAKALGERGNQDTIPKLLPLLSDDRHAVRYLAAASIVRLSLRPAGNASAQR
jgi:HEAT repeat protein